MAEFETYPRRVPGAQMAIRWSAAFGASRSQPLDYPQLRTELSAAERIVVGSRDRGMLPKVRNVSTTGSQFILTRICFPL